MISLNLTTIIIIAIAGLVVLYFAWPAFRQMVQIIMGKKVAGATSTSDKLRHKQAELTAAVNQQLTSVATAKALAVQAGKDVTAAEQELADLENNYRVAVQGNASEAAQTDLLNKIAAVEGRIASRKTAAAEATKSAKQAVAALDGAREKLREFAEKVDDVQQKEALTKVLNTAADASIALKGVTDRMSEAGELIRGADLELEKARARGELAEGSETDRELADIAKKAKADEVRARLNAKLGIGTPASGGTTEQK